MNQTLLVILMFLLVLAAMCAVMMRSLLKATICLGLTSVVLSIVLFLMKSPWAAVFELSVCAGLITVVFISAVALTKPETREEEMRNVRERRKRYIHLPFIVTGAGIILFTALLGLTRNWPGIPAGAGIGFQEALWNTRQMEVLGQIIIVLAGVFGVVVLFKERDNQ